MTTDVTFAIGDPGRAALELPDGPPPARIGPADVECSAASLPGLLVRAATCRGLMHRANGTPRQDAFALGRADGGTGLIAVVCDGVGQFGRSDEAALFTSRRLAALGAEGESWPDAFVRVNQELDKIAGEARATDHPIRTLTVWPQRRWQSGSPQQGRVGRRGGLGWGFHRVAPGRRLALDTHHRLLRGR